MPVETPVQQAIAQLSEGVQIIGFDWTYVYLNDAAAAYGPHPASDLLGRTMMECQPGIEASPVFAVLKRVMETRQRESLRSEVTYPSGERSWLDWRMEPVSAGVCILSVDVGQRTRANDEVRFQQAMMATERKLTLDAILVVDTQSRVLSYNPRFALMWGISEDILATRADSVLLSAVQDKLVDPARFMALVRALQERHDDVSHDEVDLTDGRTLDRYSAPMHDNDGRYYGRVWYFRDVTAHRQAELALRQERDRAQRYLDTADVILLALDLDGCITLINRKGYDLLGWREPELVGRKWADTCLPERARQPLAETLSRLMSGDLSVVENPVVTTSGEERLIEWRNTVLRDDRGRATGTFSSGTDITERHQAVAALRAAEERMRFALQSADVGIWDMDYATGRLECSEILEAQYGLPPDAPAVDFAAILARVHPDDRRHVRQAVVKAMRAGSDFSMQHRVLRPDGTVRWLSGAGRIVLGPDGRPVRGIGISLDITERHKLEEQYHQAQKMEAIGRLAGGVAHDFNNLLTAILGYCELLLEGRGPDDPIRADVTEIQRAGHSAAALTRQLLAFSRKQIIEPAVIDLNHVATDLRSILGRVIGEDITVVLRLAAAPALVTADRGQAEQIVMNLAVNARDAMPTGGTLTIETAHVELDDDYAATHVAVAPGAYVALTVSDTGTGMTPEVQAHIFEPFFTTKEPGKGTGLGLATVHGIVARSGGSVGVYSEPGKGTSFKVYFKRADAAAPVVAAAPPAGVVVRAGTRTVLLVEDFAGLRELTRRLLERQGFTVLVAANADEALHQFEQHPVIDILLTDVVMPGASGPELTRQLLERRPSLRVIYMSGYTEEAIIQHGVLQPGIAFLHKPFTADALGQKIRDVLDR